MIRMKLGSLAAVNKLNAMRISIAELVDKHGSVRAAARVLQVDSSYLHCLLHGKKNNPSAALLRKLGVRRIVTITYERTEDQPA